jgi:diguanylate cyclase (GGDEF)-like protein/PAS domain S-box-containing protein
VAGEAGVPTHHDDADQLLALPAHQPDRAPGQHASLQFQPVDVQATQDSWLASVLRSLAVAVVSSSNDGRIRSWNAGAEMILGYQAEEVLGRPVTVLVAPEDRLATAGLLARLFGGESVGPFETSRIRKDGSAVRVSMLLSAVRDRTGRVVGACAVMREVGGGGWLQAELDALTQEVDVVVAVLDDQLRPLSVSASIERVLGSSREDWLTERVVHNVHRDDVAHTEAVFQQWLATPGLSSAPVQYRTRHRDGSWRWVESFAHNLLDDPDVRGLVVTTWDVTERHEAEHARAEARSRIEAMFDQAVVPQFLLGLDRRILEANAALCSVLGYESHELVGRVLDEFAHPDDAAIPLPMFAEMLSGGRDSVDAELRYVRKDGSRVQIRTLVALVRDADGLPLYAAGIGSDVTERNRARRALEHSEARLRALTENSRDLVVVLDAGYRVLYVSPAITCMLGYAVDALVGEDSIGLVHPDDRAAVDARFAAVLDGGPGWQHKPFGFRVRGADGSWRYLESVPTNLMEEEAVGGVLLNIRDVSERHRATQALAESEARYRSIVETAQEGIWLVDLAGRITFANPALARMLACTVDDLIGRRPKELMGPERRAPGEPAVPTPFSAAAGEGGGIRFLAWDGRDVWATVSTSDVHAPSGAVTGSLAMVSDITERRRADLALRQSEERFRSLVQYASDLGIIADPDGKITYVTPGAERFLGQGAAELSGLNIFDWLHEEDLGRVSEALMDVLGDGRPVDERDPKTVTCRARHADATWHVVEATLSNLIDVPAVGGIVVNVRDVDEATAAAHLVDVSQRRFESLVKHSTDVILVVDAFGTVTYVSPSLEEVLRYKPVDIVGRRTRELVHIDDVPIVVALMADLRRTRAIPARAEIRVRDRHGEWLRVDLVGTNLLDDPAVGGMVFNIRDVSERVRNESELQVRAAQQAAVGRLGQRALVAMDLQQLFEESVATLGDILGIEIAAVVEALAEGGELLVRAVTGAPDGALGSVWAEPNLDGQAAYTLDAGAPVLVESLAAETRFRPHADLVGAGVVSSASVVIPGPRGPFGVLLAHSTSRRVFTADDVTFLSAVANVLGSAVQRRAYEQRLTYQATYDILTGLPNRALLLDRLRLALSRRTPGRIVGVLFIGLDRFKMLNEAYSHDLGDEVLACVGDRLWAHVRPADTVARFGGDEFAILCDDLTREEEAVELAQRVLDTLQEPFELSGERITLTASVGICLGTGHQDAETMLAEADAAMVEAKARGHGRWELFDVSFRHRIMARLQLEADLRAAVDNDELTLHYQPQVRLDTGEITGVECLLRWDHPVRGHTMPSDFVRVAEETGVIVPIGAWTVHAACAQAARWRNARGTGGLSVSVNLSGRQLDEPGLPQIIAGALSAHDLEPQLLCLEITESALMRDASQALATLVALKELGVRIAIDDFGTGYSSLAYLRRFPVDVLKIDGSFVQGLGEDPEGSAIVAAVLRLAETLGVDVVAEGVETAGQLDTLRALGCQFGQGYFFSKPVPADQI